MPQAPMLSGSGWCQGSSEVSSEGADAEGLFSGRVGVGMTETGRSSWPGLSLSSPVRPTWIGSPGSQPGRRRASLEMRTVGRVGLDTLSLELGGRLKNRLNLESYQV